MADVIVRVDREQTTGDILKYQAIGNTVVTQNDLPQVTTLGNSPYIVNLGDSIIKYHDSYNASATTVYKHWTFNRPHKLLRIEITIRNSSTGALDTGGLNVVVNAFDPNGTSAIFDNDNNCTVIGSTNGTQTVSSYVFEANSTDTQVREATTYIFALSSTNTTGLNYYIRMYVKYM